MKNKWMKTSLALALALTMLLSGCGATSSNKLSSGAIATPSAPQSAPMENAMGGMFYDTVLKEEAETEEMKELPQTSTESGTTTESDPLANKNIKLIWRANLEMETLDFNAAVEAMNHSVAEFGGYVESSYVEGGERLSGRTQNRYGNYTIRIPASKLDDFLNQMGSIGNVISRSKSSENITLEYADNEARKATLELEEKKLMELLGQATILEDIITLESRLSEVHYRLDGYASTLRKYDDLVDYSTVSIYINEVQKMTETKVETLPQRISAAFSDSLYELEVFAGDLVVFLIGRSPILLIWAVVIVILVIIIRTLLKRRKNKPRKERKIPAVPTYAQPKSEENTENKKE